MGEASRTAWVVGGGTGIGRAAAQALAGDGFHVVVSGRRAAELDATLDAIHHSGGAASALVLDVTDDDAVQDAAARLAEAHGHIDALVYCAGTNVAGRFWDRVSATDIAHVMDVNLQGAVRAVHAVLPGMRAAGAGLVVLVSSWAAWRHSPGAGAAYAMSKTALGVMAETLNAQERLHGIRATHLCPGEVATDILDTRPNPPSAEARALMLAPDDVGETVAWIARQPARVCVNELVLTPTANTSYA
ncbi:SDR family oxidoreductase [Microbacterium sp. Clip185]|uniref:SDR family oxidoreductase n=1 Tax=Microbacterium sp. Clip185 TaxID=3025663 RepID=UPI0023666422|nr:SDR family NAD(P)-dependent oxidoreductase [Microbacterium sp. Clip185]WDG18285.1 SDR family NAD(P)-dependent oxidoreductase [Microbacterium sp. Clip185]